jgi:hypothetical protein
MNVIMTSQQGNAMEYYQKTNSCFGPKFDKGTHMYMYLQCISIIAKEKAYIV